ncbi:hypothetical protein [Streptomyces canus]|uniref:hypothetical protein n=1 Tax=Streptomyces canus TaxID=58343 RepID=UPI002789AB34|nr:hypothetical protein [Streptomyces canus]MDQ1071608.1 hypothetical protein [Streptomyces canus]
MVARRAEGAPVGSIAGGRATVRDGGRRTDLPARGVICWARAARKLPDAGLEAGAVAR